MNDLDIGHLVDTAEAMVVAPNLDQAIREILEETHSIPDDMLRSLDELESEHAQEALYVLPEKERHDLVQAAKEKIRSGTEE